MIMPNPALEELTVWWWRVTVTPVSSRTKGPISGPACIGLAPGCFVVGPQGLSVELH